MVLTTGSRNSTVDFKKFKKSPVTSYHHIPLSVVAPPTSLLTSHSAAVSLTPCSHLGEGRQQRQLLYSILEIKDVGS